MLVKYPKRLKVLKNDKKAIFNAANQASKAHHYIMDLVGDAQCERKVA
jgi:antirestriction protein ArdC